METVIVLNSNYQYWTEVPVSKAVQWMCKGDKVDILLTHDENRIATARTSIETPVLVRLPSFIGYKIKRKFLQYKDEFVYMRDNNICQYWHYDSEGRRYKHLCSAEDRTIDHVHPKSRGGQTTFQNCVCCCRDHNQEKGNRTPQEAGLQLLRKPVVVRPRTGEMAYRQFTFNPRKEAHRYYQEKFLNQPFSHIQF